jgi:hypothetical protein
LGDSRGPPSRARRRCFLDGVDSAAELMARATLIGSVGTNLRGLMSAQVTYRTG